MTATTAGFPGWSAVAFTAVDSFARDFGCADAGAVKMSAASSATSTPAGRDRVIVWIICASMPLVVRRRGSTYHSDRILRSLRRETIETHGIWPARGGATGATVAAHVRAVQGLSPTGRAAQQVPRIDPPGPSPRRLPREQGGQRRGVPTVARAARDQRRRPHSPPRGPAHCQGRSVDVGALPR